MGKKKNDEALSAEHQKMVYGLQKVLSSHGTVVADLRKLLTQCVNTLAALKEQQHPNVRMRPPNHLRPHTTNPETHAPGIVIDMQIHKIEAALGEPKDG